MSLSTFKPPWNQGEDSIGQFKMPQSSLFLLIFRLFSLSFFKDYLFILRKRERARACKQGRGREREGERIPSRHHSVSTESDAELKLMNCEIVT